MVDKIYFTKTNITLFCSVCIKLAVSLYFVDDVKISKNINPLSANE